MSANNPYGFFAPTPNPVNHSKPFHDLLSLLKDFVTAHQAHLSAHHATDVILRSKLLLQYHRAKKQADKTRTEVYLETFTKDFKDNPDLQPTLELYQILLNTYRKTKIIVAELNTKAKQHPSNTIDELIEPIIHSFDPMDLFLQTWAARFNALMQQPVELAHETMPSEEQTLSPQQEALHQLQETFKHVINNLTISRSRSWHPSHHENYYLAKLKILWHNYTEQYGQLNTNELSHQVINTIASERSETVIDQHLETRI